MKTLRHLLFVVPVLLLLSNAQAQWIQTTGPEVRYVHSLGVCGTTLFAGCSGPSSLFRSTDYGSSWALADSGIHNDMINAFAFVGDYIFAGGNYGLWHSTDNGSLWQLDSIAGYPVVLPGTYGPSVYSLAVRDSTLFVGTNYGVYRTPDRGFTWTECNTGLGPNHMVLALAVQDTDVYAGIGAHAVCRSTNGGESWTIMDNGFPPNASGGSSVYCLAFTTETHLFAGLNGDGGVAHSTNRGESWTLANAGIAETGILSMASDGSNLYAGTGPNSRVYASTDNGTSWRNVSADLPTGYAINTLAAHGPYLFAGLWNPRTGGAGVWRRAVSEILSVGPSGTEFPTGFSLSQNYPNPFNPSTMIRYALPQRSHGELAVFNTLGQQVATLVDGDIEAGYHEVTFDAAGLASGVYFYRIQAGDFVQSKKLLLLK